MLCVGSGPGWLQDDNGHAVASQDYSRHGLIASALVTQADGRAARHRRRHLPGGGRVGSFIVVLGLGSYLMGRSFGLPGIFIAYAADEWVRGLLMMARWHWHGWVPHARGAMRRVRGF